MNRSIILFFCILTIFPASRLNSQKLASKYIAPTRCYAGKKDNPIYIPPPKEFFNKSGRKGGATVTMIYSGFTADAKIPMNYAASILESVLPLGTHITILAFWEKITTNGVLAQASTTSYNSGWDINAQIPYAYYPVALAEKIANKQLNNDLDGDIAITVNSAANWYLGTDGKPAVLTYDLVTVALHELIHGLGFFDSMYADATTGSYGISGVPVVYDTFVENNAGKRLTDTLSFLNPSAELKSALTSGHLYFDGPLIKNYSGVRAVLYAPTTFESGSSVSHLDESTYKALNALMTPIIDMREAIHDPGKLVMSILGDLGWINTNIIHDKPKDTEEHISSVTIQATIKSDTTYDHNNVTMVWSLDNFATSNSLIMTSPQSDNNYIATIPITSYETRLDYYLSAKDCFGRVYNLPSYLAKEHYSIYIGIDTVKPVIKHTPLPYYFERIDSIEFRAVVTDNLGVDTVFVEYKLNNGSLHHLGLFSKGEDIFKNTLIAKNLSLHGGDSISYRIVAIDKAGSPNQKTSPSAGWYSIKIEPLNPVAASYKTNFSNASGDFLNDGFSILKPKGFSSFGLNTPHPYLSPEESGDSIGYTAILRTPIKFDKNGTVISYKEVVLVEPGEEGSVFGSSGFYDYVIVEGSKNFGKSWFHLCTGYDSRYYDKWLADYNSAFDSLTGQNSTFVPDETLLIKHSIFPKVSSEISAGDTLMIRFRLFSDPYAHGWGWFIEDLNVEPLIDKVADLNYSLPVIYPNPGNGLITIKAESDISGKPFRFSIFSSVGTCLSNREFSGGSELKIDISDYPAGMYFIVLYSSSGPRTLKYTLVK